jgi:3-oxoadipate CoA-transferase beta subunit
VRKIICSFPRQVDSHHFDRLYRAGQIELELVPQGNLAERIRAAGAGIGGFFTPTGFGTDLAAGKEVREFDGRMQVLELADPRRLRADQGRTRRPLGQPHLPHDGAQLRPHHGHGRAHHHRQVHEVVAPGRRSTRRRWSRRASSCSAWCRCPAGSTQGPATPPPKACPADRRCPLDPRPDGRLVARDIPDGAYVNLGIGAPTRWWPTTCRPNREVILHSENGVLGMGPAPAPGEEDYDLINAGKQPVTLLPGGAFFHHADSFAMMRGGHLDVCVLGAFQVAVNGDLANWHTGAPDAIPAVGGAMDLATGARQTWVMMDQAGRTQAASIAARYRSPAWAACAASTPTWR